MSASTSDRSSLKRKRQQHGNQHGEFEHDRAGDIINSPLGSSIDDTIELQPLQPSQTDDTRDSQGAVNKKRRLATEPEPRDFAISVTAQQSKASGKTNMDDIGESAVAAKGSSKDLSEGSHSSQTCGQMNAEELESFREAITTNFSTRILYKHNELRLIDQEIAKCQVALEQLRRCSEIPYPSMTGIPTDMVNVSTGSGASIMPSHQSHPPISPAPWGVTEGPYTRHYAQWLIPDPFFDGGAPPPVPAPSTHIVPDSGTRSRSLQTGSDNVPTSSRSRGQRGSSTTVLQSLPSGYAQPKPERAAQIIKRHSDNMFVKLVCPAAGCGEERFNSVQGFINHCRIKHQIHFATHKDAAQRAGSTEGVDQKLGIMADAASGQPAPRDILPSVVENQAAGSTEQAEQPSGLGIFNLPSEPTHSPRRASTDTLRHSSSPTTVRAPPTASNQQADSKTASGAALTHPYNRPTLDTRRQWPEHREKLSPPTGPMMHVGERHRRQSNMGPPISPNFVASDQLPFLSERFANTGKAGNLQAMVAEAQDRFDLDNMIVPEEAIETEVDSESAKHPSRARVPKLHGMVGGLSAPLMDRRPGSKKGIQSNRDQEARRRESSTEQEENPFLSSTRSRRRRDNPKPNNAHAFAVSQDQLFTPSLGEDHSHVMVLDSPTTPGVQSPVKHHPSALSASAVKLSPGAHLATDTNQAPSLISDDGESGSESDYDNDAERDEDGDIPKADTPARISLDDSDEIVTDSAGPSGLSVDHKLGRWNGSSRSSRSQHEAGVRNNA